MDAKGCLRAATVNLCGSSGYYMQMGRMEEGNLEAGFEMAPQKKKLQFSDSVYRHTLHAEQSNASIHETHKNAKKLRKIKPSMPRE